MFKMNKKVEYALMALRHINNKDAGSLTSVKEICDIYGSPFDVTSRAMQNMVSGKLLTSEKGAYGGYLLVKDLAAISILEVIEMSGDPVNLVSCLDDISTCSLADSCNISHPLITLNKKIRDFFKTITVKEILESEKDSVTTLSTAPTGS